MEIVSVRPDIWVLRGGVNLGAIVAEGEAIFVDAGLDEGPARRLWRWAEERGLRPRAALLTHAHADHFGGAHFWETQGLPLFAPPLEAAMMRHPFLEPLFLFAGASPHPELLSKFTLARPISTVRPLGEKAEELSPAKIVPLPGHAPEQVGVAVNGVLFCTDALFTPDILAKHPIPFCYDVAQTLKSLDGLGDYEIVVPGHGAPLEGAAVHMAIQAFRTRLLELVEEVEKALSVPRSGEELVGILAQRFDAQNVNLVGFLLVRTTVYAALSFLVREGRAEAFLENGVLRWRRK